jgi:hypothetical protein
MNTIVDLLNGKKPEQKRHKPIELHYHINHNSEKLASLCENIENDKRCINGGSYSDALEAVVHKVSLYSPDRYQAVLVAKGNVFDIIAVVYNGRIDIDYVGVYLGKWNDGVL